MRQVGEWMEHYQLQPWGQDAADARNALLALVVAQSAGAKNVKMEQFRLKTPAAIAEESVPRDVALAKQVRGFFGKALAKRKAG